MFIENAGQWEGDARFQVWSGAAGTMWLADDAIWITVLEPGEVRGQTDDALAPRSRSLSENLADPMLGTGVNIKLSFVGANPQARIETFDPVDTVISYFLGNNSDQWRPAVPVWGGVRYVDLYPESTSRSPAKADGWRRVWRRSPEPTWTPCGCEWKALTAWRWTAMLFA